MLIFAHHLSNYIFFIPASSTSAQSRKRTFSAFTPSPDDTSELESESLRLRIKKQKLECELLEKQIKVTEMTEQKLRRELETNKKDIHEKSYPETYLNQTLP